MTTQKRLVFWCDANADSGLGHFMRCFELAQACRQYNDSLAFLFLGNYSDQTRARLAKSNFNFIEKDCGSTFQINTLAGQCHPSRDFLLIDSYRPKQSFYDEIAALDYRWGVFDDFADLTFKGASLVINFRVDAERLCRYESDKVALSPQFMPIASALTPLRESIGQRPISADIKKVLICLGGNDIHSASANCANRVAAALPSAKITVISADNLIDCLNQGITALPLQADISPLLADTDLLVSGGGRLKYEACYCGIANATLSQTIDQHADTMILQEHGLTVDLGMSEECNSTAIKQGLGLLDQKYRQVMRDNQYRYFPKDGNQRIAELICRVLSQP